jgi:hypothetical protein
MHALAQLLALVGLFSVAATGPPRSSGFEAKAAERSDFVSRFEGRSRLTWAHCSGERCQGDCVFERV